MKIFSKCTKLYFLVFGIVLLSLNSCSKKKKLNPEVDQIPVSFTIERFDQKFYEAPYSELGGLKREFPYLFPEQFDDAFWIAKKKDSLFGELYTEVQQKFDNLDELSEELTDFFKYIKYHFSQEPPKKVITLISEVDVASKAIYADSLALLSLDTYLGEEHRFYQGFPHYLRGTFEASQILPDLAESFALSKVPVPQDRTFLAQILYSGKLLYVKEVLLPWIPEETLMTYTLEQLEWCKANEAEMWKYMIENKLLFDTDPKLQTRFIQPSPFSKFYLDIDSESPGRVGVWLGWQIVRSYMKNNNVTLQQLLDKDAKEIFDNSRYKPRK